MIIIELFITFFKIGMIAFGGGYGALSIIQDEIVRVNSWLNISEFLDLVSISQMTPGPIAINSATFIGYRIAGVPGSLACTIGVILPSVIWIAVIIKVLTMASKILDTEKIFDALRISIVALIIAATINIGVGAVNSLFHIGLGIIAFSIIQKYKISVIWVILSCGFVGIVRELVINS